MLWVIRPEIPLNSPNWLPIIFNNEDMCRFDAINPWAVFCVNGFQTESLAPPSGDVGGRQPRLK